VKRRRRRASVVVPERLTMHAGLPLLFKRAEERRARQRERFAWLSRFVVRDASLVAVVGVVVFLLVWLTK